MPPLIAHAPVCVHEHADEVRAAVREQIMNPRLPFYQRMLVARFPEAERVPGVTAWSMRGVLWGNEKQVEERLHELFAFGATEILAAPVLAGTTAPLRSSAPCASWAALPSR